MPHFESYHPILTPNLTLDWLTATTLKDIALVLMPEDDGDYTHTAAQVNHIMAAIMADDALTWGVTERTTNQFYGTVGFTDLDQATQSATLAFQLPRLTDPDQAKELVTRLMAFAKDDLALDQLQVQATAPTAALDDTLQSFGI